ncbi:hypothetical protein SLS58_009732 [Diplodia intermedia]|uniref:Uncharacterized protein n=1 Tax=Diplodia intermedia TaxID=856260 RepID=A0ABR3TB06_9PEZI
MQLADESLPNIYAAGYVKETDIPKENARSAMKQAKTAVDSILLAIKGHEPQYQYRYRFLDHTGYFI